MRGNKYNVGPPETRTADNIIFHSTRERDAYVSFAALTRAGTFALLELQVPYQVSVTSPQGQLVPVFKWIADFRVTDLKGVVSTYDAKGFKTETYRLKKRCVEAQFGIRIIEI